MSLHETEACISTPSQPVSWLRLELYHLGELPDAESELSGAHLESCGACAASLHRLERDQRKLAPLPDRAEAPRRNPWLGWTLRLAPVAAAAVFLVSTVWKGPETPERPGVVTIKGGDVSISLVRERDGRIEVDPVAFSAGAKRGIYRSGDRFQVAVTCPGPDAMSADVVVYQSGEAHFPYEAAQRVRCGNRVPLRGAFRITGTDAVEICVAVSEQSDRDALARHDLPATSDCAAFGSTP